MSWLRGLAFGLAALISAANFMLVQWILRVGVLGQTLIPGVLDFRPTFNRGVSFGLLAQDSVAGCYFLIALLVLIVIAVAAMAWRTTAPLVSAGFGLILGGAIGNLCDRFHQCAVFDFFSLHMGSVQLFVCNFSDLAISAGVILLLAESLLVKQDPRPKPRWT